MGKAVMLYYINYFNFTGRTSKEGFRLARRWVIGSKLAMIIICVIYCLFNIGDGFFDAYYRALISYLVWWGLHIIPSIAMGVRRYHDIGKKGWGYLGQKLLWYVTFIIFRGFPGFMSGNTSADGDPKENKYGPAPLD